MKGTLLTHHFVDEADTLSGPEIFELQDENGLTIWFGRLIFKDVCISGECKMIHLWLFWDGAGAYLGIQTLKQEPLTKSDHSVFEVQDYEKLDDILRDTASILKYLKREELIIAPDSFDSYEVDGYTAATQPSFAEMVVKDAAYTCHTLWHTVYGAVQTITRKIQEARLNEEFLNKMFESQKPGYISWAIEIVEKYPEYQDGFNMKIIEFIKSNDSYLANQSLGYFQPSLMADTAVQHQLVKVMADANVNMKNIILRKLIEFGNVDEFVVLKLLEMFFENKLNVGTYNLILRFVSSEFLTNNKKIARIIDLLSDHENDHVRDLTKRLLQK